MNIAHILPRSVTLPLSEHNGRYDWVLELASYQAKTGHQVTIYCNPDSVHENIATNGVIADAFDKKLNNIATFSLAFQNEHDIYHSHFDSLHYEVAHQTQKQIVYTQHWWPSQDTISLAKKLKTTNVWAVPPTNYMLEYDRKNDLHSKGFIYHGIDLSPFKQAKSRAKDILRLLSVGRISPEKNIELTIRVALQAGIGLDIIGRIPAKYTEYYKQKIAPLIDGEQIRYLGPKKHEDLVQWYASALAVLFPSDIHEAFGLIAIEAQACGTPVIMQKGGSRGELIRDGITGFLCTTEADFVAAISHAKNVKPQDCTEFAKKFNLEDMAASYHSLYAKLIAAN